MRVLSIKLRCRLRGEIMAKRKKPNKDFKEKKPDINWEVLKHRKISLLINNPLPLKMGGGKESYVGILEEVVGDFLLLHTPNNKRISLLVVRKKMVLSIWVYKD